MFDRWKCRERYSWAFIVFKAYHNALNRQLWSYQSTVNFMNKSIRLSQIGVHDLLGISEENKRTVPNDGEEWRKHFREFENWNRLSCIMAASSYFEVYLTSIIATALESNPGILHKANRKIDGAVILKHSNSYSYQQSANEMVIGDWGKRISSIQSIFGKLPPKFLQEHSNLEKIRILRNKVGHAFGRDIEESKRKGTIKILESERVSLKVLKKYLGVIYNCAKELDAMMLVENIGAYEEIYFYHQLKPTFEGIDTIGNRVWHLKKAIGGEGLLPMGKEYCKQLIMYYDEL